jgi:hypothetical protein
VLLRSFQETKTCSARLMLEPASAKKRETPAAKLVAVLRAWELWVLPELQLEDVERGRLSCSASVAQGVLPPSPLAKAASGFAEAARAVRLPAVLPLRAPWLASLLLLSTRAPSFPYHLELCGP